MAPLINNLNPDLDLAQPREGPLRTGLGLCLGHEQAAFLRRACAGDPARLERIQALLLADSAAPQFLPPWPGLPAKDPDRRYATVSGLAADLQRFLNHEPVTARASTLRYQLAKLYRRKRKTVVTALAMAALLLAATGVSTGLAVRAHRAEVRAREQAATARNVSDFLWRELLKRLTPWSHTNAGVSLREAFESAAERIDYRLSRQPLAEAPVRFVFGKTYAGLWEYAAAESNLVRALELQRRHGGASDEPLAEFLSQLAELRMHQGRLAQAEPLYREAADIFARRLGDTHRDAVSAAAKLASVQARRLPPAEAEPLLQHHLERTTRFVAADHYVARQTLNQLGELRRDAGNLDAAHDLFAQAHRLTVAAKAMPIIAASRSQGLG